ncbi:transposase [Mesorhizobium sp. B4-1-4]|uniref:transposase n=1 Tax=Mesorhizobium sp. B4-1-4 TaxID=2589888 RepID=UPI0015E3CCD0|nr:transposase [Mesorhizobium sp. B4-1-4]UCI32003.1 transposase [Mesorhizobium sp. B4-1-4]
MRQQTRPFVVEVRQKRNYQKRDRSIWADVDLSAAFADTTRQFEEIDPPNRPLIDSDVVDLNAEHVQKEKGEYLMADAEQAEPVESATKGAKTTDTKTKSQRPRKAKTEIRTSARKNGAPASTEANNVPASVQPGRKVYSEEERTQKLGQIEKLISGGATLKSAVKQAGTSEQTYYQWKKKAAVPAPGNGELKDLLALEEENKRLKNLLAERLRKENAELKRRLGLQ